MRHLRFCSLFLIGYAFFPLLVFAKWEITPSLTVQELYSDNINLNYERDSEFVTEIAPLINFDNKNPLHPIFGFYRLQGLYFAKSNREDKIYQQVLVNAQTSFLQRSLRVNAIADHSQQVLFPQTEIGVDNMRGSRQSNVSRLMVGPDFTHPVSKWLTSFWSYRYGQVYFHEDNIENSHLQQATWNLISRNTTHFDFSSNVDWEYTQQDSLRIAESFDAIATMGYRLGPKFRAYVAGGYEEHEGQGLNNALDGTRWYVGAQYAPTRNTFIDGNWGRRAFGETYNFHALWKRKKQNFLLTYQEDITNYFQTQLRLIGARIDGMGNMLLLFQPQIRQDVFVQKVLSLNWTTRGAKISSIFQPFYEERKSQFRAKENGYGFNGEISWQKNPKINLAFLAGFNRQILLNNLKDERYQAGVRCTQVLTPHVQLRYLYNHFQVTRSFMDPIRENSVSILLHVQNLPL